MVFKPLSFSLKTTRSIAILPEPTSWIWNTFLKSKAKNFGKWIETQTTNSYMDFLFQSHSYEEWKSMFLDNYYPIIPNYQKEANFLLKQLGIDFIVHRIKKMNKTEKSIIHDNRHTILTVFKDLFRAYTVGFHFFSKELNKRGKELTKMVEIDKLYDYDRYNLY